MAVVEVRPVETQTMAPWGSNQYVVSGFVRRREPGIGAQLAWEYRSHWKAARHHRHDCPECTVNRLHVFWPVGSQKARVMALW
jgi:hypothetical protein